MIVKMEKKEEEKEKKQNYPSLIVTSGRLQQLVTTIALRAAPAIDRRGLKPQLKRISNCTLSVVVYTMGWPPINAGSIPAVCKFQMSARRKPDGYDHLDSHFPPCTL